MANRPQKAEYQVQQNLIANILYTVRRVSVTSIYVDVNNDYNPLFLVLTARGSFGYKSLI